MLATDGHGSTGVAEQQQQQQQPRIKRLKVAHQEGTAGRATIPLELAISVRMPDDSGLYEIEAVAVSRETGATLTVLFSINQGPSSHAQPVSVRMGSSPVSGSGSVSFSTEYASKVASRCMSVPMTVVFLMRGN